MTYFCDSWTWPCLGAFGSAAEVQTGVKGIPAESGGKRERVEAVVDAFEKQAVVIMGTNFSWERAQNTCHEVASLFIFRHVHYLHCEHRVTTGYVMCLYNIIEKMGQCKIFR